MKLSWLGIGGAVTIVGLLVYAAVAIPQRDKEDAAFNAEIHQTSARLAEEAEFLRWQYSTALEAPGGGTTMHARVGSKVPSYMSAADDSTPKVVLHLKEHSRLGGKAYLSVDGGMILCDRVCALQVRFDDQASEPFSARLADGVTDAVIITDDKGFFARMVKAQRLRVELPLVGADIYRAEFDISDFDDDAYLRGALSS